MNIINKCIAYVQTIPLPTLCIGLGVFIVLLIIKFSRPDIVRRKPKQGVLGYFVCYADQAGILFGKNKDFGKILYSEKYDLQGKPDYIFKKYLGRRFIPVEIKSGSVGNSFSPYDGDRLQVAVYFLIIEDIYGVKPKEGRLVYSDAMFIIKNTKRIRAEAITTVTNMRKMLRNGKGKANASYVRCRHCLCKDTVCEFTYK